MTTLTLNHSRSKDNLKNKSYPHDLELVFDTLDLCTRHLDTLIKKVKETSKLYKMNKIDQGDKQFIEITEILHLFIELITLIHHTLKVETNTPIYSNKTFQKLEIHLLSIIKALIPAKEKQDTIMLCDLLEYELVDSLMQWKIRAIPELKKLRPT